MNKRPIIKLKLNTTDIIIEAASWLAMGLLWIVIIYFFNILPNTIPVHFNAIGIADRYGDKSELFSLPIIATMIFFGITVLNKFPHIFNYLVEITPENALTQYQSATRMLRILKFVVLLIFITITLLTINVSVKKEKEINPWFTPILIGILFTITAFYILKSIKKQRTYPKT